MKFLIRTGSITLFIAGIILFNYYHMKQFGEKRMVSRSKFEEINHVLVPGAGRGYLEGLPNLNFKGRIDTAAAIWHQYNHSKLIISGYEDYHLMHEVKEMMAALHDLGVPDTACYPEDKSEDTFQTLENYKKVYGTTPVIVLSQKEHLERTLWLADRLGIEAWGYVVNGYQEKEIAGIHLREFGARVKARIDIFLMD
ncbi:MAG: YdcF family protein [Bacteroidetes bacterium]|nr:YdcF family protein [Bacteroidota bacterium]